MITWPKSFYSDLAALESMRTLIVTSPLLFRSSSQILTMSLAQIMSTASIREE